MTDSRAVTARHEYREPSHQLMDACIYPGCGMPEYDRIHGGPEYPACAPGTHVFVHGTCSRCRRTSGQTVQTQRPTLCLGFGGYAESGKDACAEILERWGWHRTMMSEPLLEAVLILDPWVHLTPEERVEVYGFRIEVDGGVDDGTFMRYRELYEKVGYERSKRVADVRQTFQRMGTDVGRRFFGENVWGDRMVASMLGAHLTGRCAVVTGLRYRSDMELFESLPGAFSVWVDRDTGDGIGAAPINAHSSDNTLSREDFTLVLANHGTLGDLCTNLYRLVEDLAQEIGVGAGDALGEGLG